MMTNTQELPHWDVSNIFPGIESQEFEAAYQEAKLNLDSLEKFMQINQISRDNQHPAEDILAIGVKTSELIERLSEAFRLVHTLNNYVYCFITTDSFDVAAARQYSIVQAQLVRLLQAEKVVSGWLGSLGNMLDTVINQHPIAQAHAFYLRENARQSKYLMSDSEEKLANQLSLSGIRAWGKLQGTVNSQLSIDFSLDGKTQTYPLAALQNIRRYNPDPLIRQKAFQAEIQALSNVKEILAACLNGVAGYNIVVFRGQQREDALHHSLDTARIDRSTL
jgi:oligoendopeptidase F